MFYAQSWALTHMLQLSPEYRAGFAKFAQQIESGADAVAAMQGAYGRTIPQIQNDLARYMSGNRFFGVNFDIKLKNKLETVAAEAANTTEMNIVLAALLAGAGKKSEAVKLLDDLKSNDPNDPSVAVAYGYLHWRQGEYNDARASFERAYKLGTSNPRVLYDLARMLRGGDSALAAKALLRLKSFGPLDVETKLLLGEIQLARKQYGAAHSTLSDITRVSSEEAFRLMRIRALAYDGMSANEEALDAAKKALDYARDENGKQIAASILRYLNAKNDRAEQKASDLPEAVLAAVAKSEGGPTFDEDEIRDGKRFPDQTGNMMQDVKRSPSGKPLQLVRGEFTALECKGQLAIVVLKTSEGQRQFLIREPGSLIATNKGKAMEIDLTCGPQPAKPVAVWYEDVPGRDPGAVLWQIHFQ